VLILLHSTLYTFTFTPQSWHQISRNKWMSSWYR